MITTGCNEEKRSSTGPCCRQTPEIIRKWTLNLNSTYLYLLTNPTENGPPLHWYFLQSLKKFLRTKQIVIKGRRIEAIVGVGWVTKQNHSTNCDVKLRKYQARDYFHFFNTTDVCSIYVSTVAL